jgi:hypothetical protein
MTDNMKDLYSIGQPIRDACYAHNNILAKMLRFFIHLIQCQGSFSDTEMGREFDCEGIEDESGLYCETCLCCLDSFGRYDPDKGQRSILFSLVYHYSYCNKEEWDGFKQSFCYCMKNRILR